MKTFSKRNISLALILLIFCQILFTGCLSENTQNMQSTQSKRQTVRPENEGVDTETRVVGYKDYVGDNQDLFLKQGDKIAVISPSSTPTREQTDAVMKGLEKWGYVPVEGKYACVEERTLQECQKDLTWALEDPEIKAIFCVRGGYASTEVMDRMSLDMVKNAGKLIIGYSDITIYHSAWIREGMPSIHASMSAAFTDLPEVCLEAQQKLMQGQVPSYECKANEYCKEGSARGVLIGGNLSTFTACIGTEYDPTDTDEPYILFLEDVGEDIQHIHRYLTILKHLGVLDKAQAIIFGEWTDNPDSAADYSGDSRGGEFTSVTEMIDRQFAQELDIPIAYGFPAGHGDVNYPLLMGEEAELVVADESFTITYCK